VDAVFQITERDLREAIEGAQLVVYYQPKVSLSAEEGFDVHACEALVRWQHPQYGMVFPDAFIPLAEATGLISPLTDRVVAATVNQIRLWEDQGLSLSVAVNLTPRLLDDLELPDRFSDLMERHGLPASRLIVEITESGAMADATKTTDILVRFRLKGFGLSLDDFGTGYSSLVQLHRMPFSEMKIDRSFVMDMDHDEEAKAIVHSIVHLGHNLGLHLCAEGVETLDSLKWLREAGCETAQGYYMSRPIPAEDVPSWRDEWLAKDMEPRGVNYGTKTLGL